jgi:uncharacterized membrane protein (DUF106 family)
LLSPPDSTVLVAITSIFFSVISNALTRVFVDIDAERRMRAEVSKFTKELQAAIKSGNKQEEEKLKKKQATIQQMQLKMQKDRLKVVGVTIVPFFILYYIIVGFIGSTWVAYSPFYLPFIMEQASNGSYFQVSLFGWYFICSFAFSGIISRIFRTSV